MSRSLEIRGCPSIMGTCLQASKFFGIAAGAVVKVTAGQKSVYAIIQVGDGQPNTNQVGLMAPDFLARNGIVSGSIASIEACRLPIVQDLVCYVSVRDELVVDWNQATITASFLDQIKAVWPSAWLPLTYRLGNIVWLQIKPEDLAQPSIISELANITIKSNNNSQNTAQNVSLQLHRANFVHERALRLHPNESYPEDGHLNKVWINPNQYQRIMSNPSKTGVFKIYHAVPLTHSFQTKGQTESVIPTQPPYFLAQIIPSEFVQPNYFVVSHQFAKICFIPQSIIISSINSVNKKSTALSFLLKSKTQKLVFSCAQTSQEAKSTLAQQLLSSKETLFIRPSFFRVGKYIFELLGQSEPCISFPNSIEAGQSIETCLEKIQLVPTTETLKKALGFSALKREVPRAFNEVFEQTHEQVIKQLCAALKDECLRFILITSSGPNGKSYLLEHYIAGVLRVPCSLLNLAQLAYNRSVSTDTLKNHIRTYVASSPHEVILVDGLDDLCKFYSADDLNHKERFILSEICSTVLLEAVKTFRKRIIATAKTTESVNKTLFQKVNIVLELKNPTRQARLKSLTQHHKVDTTQEQILGMVDQTQSYNLATFYSFLTEARNSQKTLKSPTLKGFQKVAGLKMAKHKIKQLIEGPIKHSQFYSKLPIKLPRSVLLYGPSGNGKTLLASALEEQFPMSYLRVRGTDLLDKYIGSSEAAVRALFEKAAAQSPCIIFIDELDSIVPARSADGNGVTDRIVNQFLCYLDGVSSLKAGVFLVAASSKPDTIDPAILRPGRLDTHIELTAPSEEERLQLIGLLVNSLKVEGLTNIEMAQATQGYSYADIIGFYQELKLTHSSDLLKLASPFTQLELKLVPKAVFYRVKTTFQSTHKEPKALNKKMKQILM